MQTQKPSSEHPLGLRDQKKWLVLLTPAVEKAGEMAGELAKAVGAKAEVPSVLSQGRHLRYGPAMSLKAIFYHWLRKQWQRWGYDEDYH
jgi:hypothetical protein